MLVKMQPPSRNSSTYPECGLWVGVVPWNMLEGAESRRIYPADAKASPADARCASKAFLLSRSLAFFLTWYLLLHCNICIYMYVYLWGYPCIRVYMGLGKVPLAGAAGLVC